MENFAYFFSGIVVGGLVSWAISHEYFRKGHYAYPECVGQRTIGLQIDDAWSALTKTRNLRYLHWYVPDPKDDFELKLGVELICNKGSAGSDYRLYITELEPPRLLAFGTTPLESDTRISLTTCGDGTRIFYSRRLTPHVSHWWDHLPAKFFSLNDGCNGETCHHLVEADLERLLQAFGNDLVCKATV